MHNKSVGANSVFGIYEDCSEFEFDLHHETFTDCTYVVCSQLINGFLSLIQPQKIRKIEFTFYGEHDLNISELKVIKKKNNKILSQEVLRVHLDSYSGLGGSDSTRVKYRVVEIL